MSLSTFWIEDPLSSLPTLPGFDVVMDFDLRELAKINRISPSEITARKCDGHRAYVARIDGQPVAYGWVATRQAFIGELELNLELTTDDSYLWDFATLPEWQGRGLYPRLLQSILQMESNYAKRFWIIHAPENLPSGAGMNKAGFEPVGQLSFTADGKVGLAAYPDSAVRATVGAALLKVPLIESVLSPCWCCGGMIARHPDRADSDACWPPSRVGNNDCSCALKVKAAPSTAAAVSQ